MKKCLFLLTLYFCQNCLAQTVPSVVTIDFLKPTSVKKYTTAKYGDKIVVKIENINRGLYKIEGSLTQSNLHTDLPEIFSGIKLPGYLNLSLPETPKITSDAEATPFPGDDEIKKSINVINASSTYLNATADFNNKISNLYQSCGVSFDTIEMDLKKITKEYLPSSYGDDRTSQEIGLRTELTKAISSAVGAKTKIEKLLPAYIAGIDLTILNYNNTIIWEWENFPLPKTNKNYRKGLEGYRNAKNMNDAHKAHKDLTIAIVNQAFELVTEMEKFRDENKVEQLVNNYKLINSGNFTYLTDSLDVESDEIKLSIKIEANKPLTCKGYDKLVIEETYRTKGGIKIDFSSGVFFNFGSDDFLGRDIYYKNLSDTEARIESKDGGGRALLSIGALMHIYKRSGTNFNWGISPGLSTTTAFDGLNFHLGPTFLFGKKERIVITAGITFREAEILDKSYSYNTTYLKSELPESPPTIKVFPISGGFLSVTYNLSSLKKE